MQICLRCCAAISRHEPCVRILVRPVIPLFPLFPLPSLKRCFHVVSQQSLSILGERVWVAAMPNLSNPHQPTASQTSPCLQNYCFFLLCECDQKFNEQGPDLIDLQQLLFEGSLVGCFFGKYGQNGHSGHDLILMFELFVRRLTSQGDLLTDED